MDECDETVSSSKKSKESPNGAMLAPLLASPSVQIARAELLWKGFIKNMSKRQQTSSVDMTCKYPNPNVPEFYPRNMKIVCTEVSHETGDSVNDIRPAIGNAMQQNVDILNITRVSQQCLEVQPTLVEVPEILHGVAHYCWAFHDPNLTMFEQTLKRGPIKFNVNTVDNRTTDLSISTNREPPGEIETQTRTSFQDLHLELHTKNQQLVHMNNVVKALLEEIYKINEHSMRNRMKEQGTSDVHSSVEQFVKAASDLGFPCEDYCSKLKELVSHVFKQLERKIIKQQSQYRSSFVDCILSVIENSLHTLSHHSQIDEDTKKQLRKQDAYTQTSPCCCQEPCVNCCDASSRADPHTSSKQQMTRVYRNRNLYRCDVAKAAHSSNWYPNSATVARNNRLWRRSGSSFVRRRKMPTVSFKPASTSSLDVDNSRNPVQLIHQRFKNLNCRLEGIPEKKLVKFSYIVNNKEYSAIATTKKEAQYLCAWHMLNSCKE